MASCRTINDTFLSHLYKETTNIFLAVYSKYKLVELLSL
jgi:hypothetical protein